LQILPSRMGFEFVFTKKAKQDLGSLDRAVAKRIVRKLLWWQKQTDPFAYAKRLQEPSSGDVRFRVGDYRLVAVVNHVKKRIEIVKIGHRREIYRND